MTTDEILISFGSVIRAVTKDDSSEDEVPEGTVGGILIPFTDPDNKDLYETYWDERSYLGALAGNGMDTFIHHTHPLADHPDLIELAERRLKPMTTRVIEGVGLWAEVVLDLADEYEKAIHQMVTDGKLSWSSGSARHLVRIDEDGFVRQWPVIEGSLTPTPGTPFDRTKVTTLRAYMDNLSPKATAESGAETPATTPDPVAPTEATRDAGAVTETPAKQDTPYRADLLGDWLESQIATSSLYDINQALYWRLSSIIYNYDNNLTVDEQLALMPDYFDEHKALCMRIITAILKTAQTSASDTAEAIRALFPKESPIRAAEILASKYRTLLDDGSGLVSEGLAKIYEVINADKENKETKAARTAPATEASAEPAETTDETRSSEEPATTLESTETPAEAATRTAIRFSDFVPA